MKALLFFIILSFLSCGFAPINNTNYDSKKVYFTFADVTSSDGGEGGVGMASIFLKNKYNKNK